LDQIAVEVNKKQEIKQRIVAKKQEIANLEEKIRDLTRDEQVHCVSKHFQNSSSSKHQFVYTIKEIMIDSDS
jgi:ABC-type Fe3+-citrate transport system substrate-binding protein